MPSKKFELASTEEEAKKQLTGFFERALRANRKFELYCELLGINPQGFYDANREKVQNSVAFQEWEQAVKTTFGLETNKVEKELPALDFGNTPIQVPRQKK